LIIPWEAEKEEVNPRNILYLLGVHQPKGTELENVNLQTGLLSAEGTRSKGLRRVL